MNPPHGDSPVCEPCQPSGSRKGAGDSRSVGHANCENRHALPYLNNPIIEELKLSPGHTTV